jgi:Domain of unknown function (DUF1772)
MSFYAVHVVPAAGVLGIVTSTAFAATSLTISSLTASALLLPPKPRENWPPKDDDSPHLSWHLARQWKTFEALAHNVSIFALVVGTSSFIYAGLKCSASAPLQRRLFFISAGFNLLTIPYTLLFMVRKNTELENRSRSGKKSNLEHTDTYGLMQNVSTLGKVRGVSRW